MLSCWTLSQRFQLFNICTACAQVASVEADLQAAHALARSSRAQLAGARAEVGANLGIARRQRRRQGLAAILGTLQQLHSVTELHGALRCGSRAPRA